MSAELSSIQFISNLKSSVAEFKKQMGDVRDESDAAHFFDPALKSFLLHHKKELDILSTMNFERPFMLFLKRFIYTGK
jgi:hypothetical protein